MATTVANTIVQLEGKTLVNAEDAQTVTGAKTFDRDPSAPFIVTSGSAVVTNLNADTVDGFHAADIGGADEGSVETITGVWTFTTNPVFNANAIPETAIADGSVLARLAGTEAITGVWTFNSRSLIKAGSAASLKAGIGGCIYSSFTTTGNVGAGEDTLYSQSIPADVLATNGDALIVEAWGTMVADAGTKTLRLKWDGTTFQSIADTTAATSWFARTVIGRRGATSQVISSVINGGTGEASVTSATSAATLSGAVTFAITGEGVNNNDLTVECVRIYWEPVNV